jgi:hypothetical protein
LREGVGIRKPHRYLTDELCVLMRIPTAGWIVVPSDMEEYGLRIFHDRPGIVQNGQLATRVDLEKPRRSMLPPGVVFNVSRGPRNMKEA